MTDIEMSVRSGAVKPRRRGMLYTGAIVVLALAVPFLTARAPYMLTLATYALIAAIVAISLDVLMGNTALISFGHAGWYGLGTFTGGLFAKHVATDIVLVLLACVLVAAVVSCLIGLVLVRQVGKTFAIMTLAFSQIMFSMVFVASRFTGGEDGLQGVPQASFLVWPIASAAAWYWFALGVVVVLLLAATGLRRSPLGKTWLAIRENEQRASFIGLDAFRMKLAAYVLSACLAALAGGIFVLFAGVTSPDALSWVESGKIMMYVILGGVGTIVGPALGAVVFTFAEYYVNAISDAWLIYFGGLFVVVVIVAPGGLMGLMGVMGRMDLTSLPGLPRGWRKTRK